MDLSPALSWQELLFVSQLQLDLRPGDTAGPIRDPFFNLAMLDVLDRLWTWLAIILALVGVLTWLTALLESAMLRRRLPG